MAVGFEKMYAGSLKSFFGDRVNPLLNHTVKNIELRGGGKAPFAAMLFGNAGREHMERFKSKPEHFAKVAAKNRQHSVNNPYSQFRKASTVEEVLKSRQIWDPLTMLQCCPTSDGAACAILCSERFMYEHNLQD